MLQTEYGIVRLRIESPGPQSPYSLQDLASAAGVHPWAVEAYVREGILDPIGGEPWQFDDEALFELRRIQRLRRDFGVNIAGVGLIIELLRRIEQLEAEAEKLRAQGRART